MSEAESPPLFQDKTSGKVSRRAKVHGCKLVMDYLIKGFASHQELLMCNNIVNCRWVRRII